MKGKVVELEKVIGDLDGKYGKIALKINDVDVAVNGMNRTERVRMAKKSDSAPSVKK